LDLLGEGSILLAAECGRSQEQKCLNDNKDGLHDDDDDDDDDVLKRSIE
jgi:hypothetical protein